MKTKILKKKEHLICTGNERLDQKNIDDKVSKMEKKGWVLKDEKTIRAFGSYYNELEFVKEKTKNRWWLWNTFFKLK